jgi:hypothetical protein
MPPDLGRELLVLGLVEHGEQQLEGAHGVAARAGQLLQPGLDVGRAVGSKLALTSLILPRLLAAPIPAPPGQPLRLGLAEVAMASRITFSATSGWASSW